MRAAVSRPRAPSDQDGGFQWDWATSSNTSGPAIRGFDAPRRKAAGHQRGFDGLWRDDQHCHSGEIGRLRRLRVGRRKGKREGESRARPGRAFHRDGAAHGGHQAPRNRKPEAGAAETARRAAFGLLELVENARLVVSCDADAGVADRKCDRRPGGLRIAIRRGVRRRSATPPVSVNSDGVAGEVEQDLAQPQPRIAHIGAGDAVVDKSRDLDAFCLGARRQELDHVFDERAERERLGVEVEPAGFDLGEIENLLDQRQQRVPPEDFIVLA